MIEEAESLEKTAAAYLARAKQLRSVAAAIRALQKESALPLREQYDTLDAMNTSEIDTRPGIPGRKFTTRHPLTAKAKALKIPIKDVAEQLSKKLKRTIPRTTVRSWYAPKDSGDGRPIPEDAVKFFEADPWDIPRSAWKNGISEP